jgi:signal transduction histidine kinase
LSELQSSESARLAEARSRASARLRRQRSTLRPLGIAVIAAVGVSTAGGHPAPALHGKGLGVTIALVIFAGMLLRAAGSSFTAYSYERQAAVIGAMGAAGVALAALQPRGATQLAGSAAVWMAVGRLPVPAGPALGGAIALVVATALAGGTAASVVATALLCALIGAVAYFVQQARAGQDRTELLLAQLEDAREEQLAAAALAERSRIAGELHDVLAHSLSGAAIQLQGARVLAEREHAGEQVRAAIERPGELVRDGLANARQAVGALRGDLLESRNSARSSRASATTCTPTSRSRSKAKCARSLPTPGSSSTVPPRRR